MEPNQTNNNFPEPAASAAPTPMAPASQPMQSTYTGTTMAPVPKSSNKVLIIIFSILGGLLLLGGAIVAALMLLGVSQKDYQTAYDTVGDAKGAYSEMQGMYISPYSTETELENDISSFKTDFNRFNQSYTKLEGLKAIKNDREVSVVFDKLVAKKSRFDEGANTAIEAYEKVMPALLEIESGSSEASTLASMSDARAKLADLELSHQVNKEVASSLSTQLKDLVDLATQLNSASSYDYQGYSDYYDLVDEMRDTITSWESDLQKLSDDTKLADELNDLSDILFNKANSID